MTDPTAGAAGADPCAAGDGVDCRQVLDAVYVYLDGEADDARANLVRSHLDDCVACLRAYGLEREVKLLVARCCGSDRAPDELRVKVLTKIRTIRVEFGPDL
jgi:mycothiol system anti-sigma-R factor